VAIQNYVYFTNIDVELGTFINLTNISYIQKNKLQKKISKAIGRSDQKKKIKHNFY